MGKLRTGDPAPAFAAQTSEGGTLSLRDMKGKPFVLYFYPKDDTPGCTKEACSFQDHLALFRKLGAAVVGVSPDGSASHRAFAARYGLRFTLLGDEDHTLASAFGVWKRRTMYGRSFMGVERTTFVIDGKGIVRAVFPKVKVEGHAALVAETVRSLGREV
ncbi:MAG: peroxiredoxin [Bacteroidota bacterium]